MATARSYTRKMPTSCLDSGRLRFGFANDSDAFLHPQNKQELRPRGSCFVSRMVEMRSCNRKNNVIRAYLFQIEFRE